MYYSTVNKTWLGTFDLTHHSSASNHYNVYKLSEMTNILQTPSNVPTVQIKPTTLVVCCLQQTALFLTFPQKLTNLRLATSCDMQGGVFIHLECSPCTGQFTGVLLVSM